MFERFFPDEYLDSAYVVNYEKLYQEGYRGILFDIDNTLVPHGAPADPEAVRLFQQLRGYVVALEGPWLDRLHWLF